MKLNLVQSARLEQRLIQSPQMIQAMQILQLPSMALEERIEQELVENPFLEQVAPESDAGEAARLEERSQETPESQGVESMLDTLERYERDFGDGTRTRFTEGEDGDRKYEAMQNAPSQAATLAESLFDEIAILDLSDRRRLIIEHVLYSLDERGYLPDPLEEIATQIIVEDEPPVTVEELESVLEELRSISHPGLGAHDLRECLLLQIDAKENPQPLLRSIVDNHLPDVEANRLPRIAKATGRDIEDVKATLLGLRHLDPSPGAEFGGSQAATILPDVVVEEFEGEYRVICDRARAPNLRVSPAYREMLKQAQKGDGVRDWIRKRVENARWFIDAVQQRQSTLERIAEAVFRHQRGFLDKGVPGLQVLRMQEIADEVHVHISTVSRAVSGKYAQTPRGIFPLKFFFTGGTETGTGEVASQLSIKEQIAEIVRNEDGQKPYSDDQLAAKLLELHDIKIARRTVTKYRKALDIPSSSQRRQF